MIIHTGYYSIQTDSIAYICNESDGGIRIIFVGEQSIDLPPDEASMFMKQLDLKQGTIALD